MKSRAWEGLLAEHVRRNSARLFGVAVRILRNAQDAEDACQAAFAKAWQHQDAIQDPHRALGGWLHQVVVNESLQMLRRRRTEKKGLEARTASQLMLDEPIQRLDRRDEVLAALSRLHEPVRTIVVLRIMQGLTGNEVARSLDISAAEVSRKLHEGMGRLREIIPCELWTG